MENLKSIKKISGVDVGYHLSVIDPVDRKGCIGKRGIDKNYKLVDIIKLAKEAKANIIVKGGKNAKWYLKNFPLDKIEEEIDKQRWRDTSRYSMWILEWDD